MTFDEQFEKQRLLRGQAVFRVLRRTELAEQRYDLARDLGRHRRAAFHGLANALDETRRRRLLEQVAARPRAHRLEDLRGIVIDRQNDGEEVRVAFLENPDALDSRHPGEADVDQSDIRQVCRKTLQRFLHRGKPARASESFGGIDQIGQPLANLTPVFDDGYGDHLRGRCRVRTTSVAVHPDLPAS